MALLTLVTAGHTTVIKPLPLRPAAPGGFDRATFGRRCDGCPLRSDCTTSPAGRSLHIGPHDRQLVAVRQQAGAPEFAAVCPRRSPGRTVHRLAGQPRAPTLPLPRRQTQPARPEPPRRGGQPHPPAQPRRALQQRLDDARTRPNAAQPALRHPSAPQGSRPATSGAPAGLDEQTSMYLQPLSRLSSSPARHSGRGRRGPSGARGLRQSDPLPGFARTVIGVCGAVDPRPVPHDQRLGECPDQAHPPGQRPVLRAPGRLGARPRAVDYRRLDSRWTRR